MEGRACPVTPSCRRRKGDKVSATVPWDPTYRDGEGGHLPPLACRGFGRRRARRKWGCGWGDLSGLLSCRTSCLWALLQQQREEAGPAGAGAGAGAWGLGPGPLDLRPAGTSAGPSLPGHLPPRLQGPPWVPLAPAAMTPCAPREWPLQVWAGLGCAQERPGWRTRPLWRAPRQAMPVCLQSHSARAQGSAHPWEAQGEGGLLVSLVMKTDGALRWQGRWRWAGLETDGAVLRAGTGA